MWATAGAFVLLVLVVLPGTTLGWAYRAMWLPVATLATMAVIDGCRRSAPIAKVLAAAPLRAVGVRAYSIYLWHMPVLWLAWWNLPHQSPWLVLAVFVVALPVVTALAFRLFERPTLTAGRRERGPGTAQNLSARPALGSPS
jgi:peptidoglycan/LPS O-acetylase OafA/YrhL